MARGATISVENNFTQGLITEYSAMNFPENAVTDGDNVVFSELGRVTRRSGINIEEGSISQPIADIDNIPGVFNEFRWEAVGGQGDTTFLVQQIGPLIYFFQISESSLSSGLKSFTVDLRLYKTNVSDEEVANRDCSFTSGKGYLFIAHPFCTPLAVEYFDDSDTIETNTIDIQIRDFERLDDGLVADERPTTLSPEHQYNLLNQGWYHTVVHAHPGGSGPALNIWDGVRSDFPSNADIWWVYRGAVNLVYFGHGANSDITIGPDQVTLGNTPAPNGHYIYNAWNLNRTTATGVTGIPQQTSGNARPSCVAFYAGRIFYAGISANKYSDKIYFSQIIESDDQFGKCYQANDPTSETTFDLLDSDGGVISLPLVSKITALEVIGDSLIVIGTNGIFAIRGSDNGPFRATNYSTEYVSEVGTASPRSIIAVDGSLIWWNYDAMYALGKDQVGISFQVQNISKSTIQSILDGVPSENKIHVKGWYNKKNRVIQWLFNDQIGADRFSYNRVLEFNVVSRAFYTHTISTSDNLPKIVGVISIFGTKKTSILENVVTDSSEIITNNSSENVQIEASFINPNTEVYRYVTLTDNGFTYSEQVDEHRDWGSVDFLSYCDSGYRIRGELLRYFQSSPITVTLEQIEDGEIIVKGIWDYGARVTTPQWLYLRGTDLGDYFIRRIKLRGKGRSLQLRFESEGSAPFILLGWSSLDTGGQLP